MKYVQSFSRQNAVKIIAFDVKLASNLSPDDINKFILKYQDKEDYKTTPQQEFTMTATSDGVTQQVIQNSGVTLEKDSWKISINKTQIVLICNQYTRWENIFKQAFILFSEVYSSIDIQISQIILEYNDEFQILDAKASWKEELFKKECHYITPNIYELNDYWHVYHGYFITVDKIDDKLLDNIRINYYADETDSLKEKVNIITQHTLSYANLKNLDDVKHDFNEIHKHSKKIFEKIVHDDILHEFDGGKSV